MNGMIRGSDMSRAAASCKIIADKGEIITRFVCKGLGFDTDWLGEHLTIGFMRGGRLIGGLIYHDCRPGRDVWWTLYTTDKHWCTKKALRFIFALAFDFYHCRRISMLTGVNNAKCLKLAYKLGFRAEGILREYNDDGQDAVIMALYKQQSKF